MRSAVLLLLLVIPSALAEEPRAISEGERAAVETAVAYLERGPEAVYERLSAGSPFRALSKAEALAEIEVRLGPPAEASWELQTPVPALQDKVAMFSVSFPSGVDDSVAFDMVREGDAYRIADIRVLAQPSTTPQIFPPEPSVVAADVTGGRTPLRALILGLGLIATLMTAGSVFLHKPSASAARVILLAGMLIGVAALAIAVLRDPRFAFPKIKATSSTKASPAVPRLASLLPVRRAMASGAAMDAAVHDPAATRIATLWKAQAALQAMRTAEVEAALKRFPSPSDVPLAEVLRARLAFFQNRESSSVMAYEAAVSLGPGRDGLWFETAQSLSTLGFDQRSKDYLRQLARVGSRNADVHYGLATIAAMEDQPDVAEKELRKAWSMRPVPREWLVRAGVFWNVLRRPSMVQLVNLSQGAEPAFASPRMSARPIRVPAGAVSRVAGEYLHIQLGEQELSVPGGAMIAPVGTPAVDAESWLRAERDQGLADVPRISLIAQTAGAYTQPALRRRVERAVNALAARNRWSDVVQVTSGISPSSEHVPVQLFFHRANALRRMQRHDEAKKLVVQLAASPVLARKKDAHSMEELAGMLSSMDLFDAAVRMLDRAAAIRPNPLVDDRARQIQMNKLLHTGYGTVRTPHFEIHYPREMFPGGAERVGQILEAEQARLQKWVPLRNMKPVVINLLSWEDFRSTYTGNDFILGFYNGKITVPLAGVPDYIAEIVTLLTHELCHAMVAQATNDQAPHWFQEGLAQRVEMRPYHPNAFNMYEDDRLLSVALLDAVITGSPDPQMITEGYIESQAIIRYLESAYGAQAVPKMIAAFHAGQDTAGALRSVSGLDVPAFDTRLRAWGRSTSRVFENPEPVRYDSGARRIR